MKRHVIRVDTQGRNFQQSLHFDRPSHHARHHGADIIHTVLAWQLLHRRAIE
jgi:hypothetical protein